MSAAVGEAVDAAKKKAESVIADAPPAVKNVAENPVQAKNDFLHHPAVRAALPFVNGGMSSLLPSYSIAILTLIFAQVSPA